MSYLLRKVAAPIAILFLFISSSIAKADDTQPKEEVFYYLHDHLSGIDVVMNEDGNVVERKDYLPYGNEQQQLNPQQILVKYS